jgi:hypothetical protein
MARFVVKDVKSATARDDLRGVVRDDAKERKAKVTGFRESGGDLEFVITPDAAADEIIEELKRESGLQILKVSSRFAAFAQRHGLSATKPEREKS